MIEIVMPYIVGILGTAMILIVYKIFNIQKSKRGKNNSS